MQVSANKDFSLNVKTKDGDELSFSMYDKKNMSAKKDAKSLTLALKSELGFDFKYSGNGLSKEDLAEIKEAVKAVQPQLDEFMKDSRISELHPEKIIKTALKIGDALPIKANEDEKKALMSELIEDVGKKLLSSQAKLDDKDAKELKNTMFENSKKLLEELWEQINKNLKDRDTNIGFYA